MCKSNQDRLLISVLILSGLITTGIIADKVSILIITPFLPHHTQQVRYKYELLRLL